MRGSLIFGALLALAACLFVPYRYVGTELVTETSTGTGASWTRPIDGIRYAPLWNPPTDTELESFDAPSGYAVLPNVESIALDKGRLLATLGAIAALTVILVVGTRRDAVPATPAQGGEESEKLAAADPRSPQPGERL